MSRYGRFYWPLALNSLVLFLESQFQNGVLARYPHASIELATFALATSSFQLVNALLAFVPQMVTVLARTPADRALCRRFVNGAGLALSLPLLLMGFTTGGQAVIARLLNISPDILPTVVRYLQWLAPLVWVNAMRHYCTGILVLGERTRTVTLLNVAHLTTLVGVLFVGQQAGWGALPTVAVATVSSNVLHLALGLAASRRVAIPDHHVQERASVTFGGLLTFFWPLATTSALFAMTRPVLYAFVNLAPKAVVSIAALRVAFDFGVFFWNAVNQFRHVYATFGATDPKGVTRFMFKVTALLLVVMALLVFTPASRLLFGVVLGLEGEVLDFSLQSVRVLCVVPVVICVRNLYHGRLMVGRRTGGMALAAALRVGGLALAAKIALECGRLTHVTAAMILVLGFVIEAAMAGYAAKRRLNG